MAIRSSEFQNPFSEENFRACFEFGSFNEIKYQKLLNPFFCCQPKDKYEDALHKADLQKLQAALKCHNLGTQCLKALLDEVDRRMLENLKAEGASFSEQLSREKQKKEKAEGKIDESLDQQHIEQPKQEILNAKEKLSHRIQQLQLHAHNLTKDVELNKKELLNLLAESETLREKLAARIVKKERVGLQEVLDEIPIVNKLSDKGRKLVLAGLTATGIAAYFFISKQTPPIKDKK